MVEQLDLLSQQSQHEAAIALVRRALIVADQDGSFDRLSDEARRLIGMALLPPPGGVEAIIAGLQSDYEWTKALLAARQPVLDRLALLADEIRERDSIPTPRPNYNRHGYVVRDFQIDLDVIEAVINPPVAEKEDQPDEMQEWNDYDPDC